MLNVKPLGPGPVPGSAPAAGPAGAGGSRPRPPARTAHAAPARGSFGTGSTELHSLSQEHVKQEAIQDHAMGLQSSATQSYIRRQAQMTTLSQLRSFSDAVNTIAKESAKKIAESAR